MDVTLEGCEYLKADGTEAAVPVMMAWPKERIPLPKDGGWLIVCAAAAELRCAIGRTPETLAQVKRLFGAGR